jgi:glycosyltransferase involved in cell wall biosynthesis
VGCFARVVPVKDQMTLIKASRRVLEKHQANFVFVGEVQDDGYYNECQALVQELGLVENVKFIGHTDNVVKWYQQSDIFVLSSQSEGVPLALLEAMSCGLPCVCTAVGGVPDILSDSGVGYTVSPNDSDSLASRISELLENATLRRAMGMHARDLVRRKYTVEKMSQKILEVYVETLVEGALRSGSTQR